MVLFIEAYWGKHLLSRYNKTMYKIKKNNYFSFIKFALLHLLKRTPRSSWVNSFCYDGKCLALTQTFFNKSCPGKHIISALFHIVRWSRFHSDLCSTNRIHNEPKCSRNLNRFRKVFLWHQVFLLLHWY